MAQKQIVTSKEIIQDIINSIKHPAKEMSQKSYKKLIVPCILIAIAFCVIEVIYPKFVLFVLLSIILVLVALPVINFLKIKHQIKNVRMEDYEISTDTLSHKEHDSYVVKGPTYHSHRVNLYTLNFESKKTWRISPKNYTWSERNSMSDFGIHESSHRGDSFITITHKKSGKIVMAYHTDIFEYKNN